MNTDPRARLYLVKLNRQAPGYTGACIGEDREVLAYSAHDARLQVEISFEGVYPPDPFFRVTSIEPLVIRKDGESAPGDHVTQRLDLIVGLLEDQIRVVRKAAEEAELATHRAGCKCGRC